MSREQREPDVIAKLRDRKWEYKEPVSGYRDAILAAYDELRAQLEAAERERDDARRTSQYWKDNHIAANAENDLLRTRAERTEQIVENVKAVRLSPLCCDGENNEWVDAYHEGFNAALDDVAEAIAAALSTPTDQRA